jgi:hypothetical protein
MGKDGLVFRRAVPCMGMLQTRELNDDDFAVGDGPFKGLASAAHDNAFTAMANERLLNLGLVRLHPRRVVNGDMDDEINSFVHGALLCIAPARKRCADVYCAWTDHQKKVWVSLIHCILKVNNWRKRMLSL